MYSDLSGLAPKKEKRFKINKNILRYLFMNFKIISKIEKVEQIARSKSIKNLSRLEKYYGKGNWLKMKGFANIQLQNGKIYYAEIHWYEANGIGKFEYIIKSLI